MPGIILHIFSGGPDEILRAIDEMQQREEEHIIGQLLCIKNDPDVTKIRMYIGVRAEVLFIQDPKVIEVDFCDLGGKPFEEFTDRLNAWIETKLGSQERFGPEDPRSVLITEELKNNPKIQVAGVFVEFLLSASFIHLIYSNGTQQRIHGAPMIEKFFNLDDFLGKPYTQASDMIQAIKLHYSAGPPKDE